MTKDYRAKTLAADATLLSAKKGTAFGRLSDEVGAKIGSAAITGRPANS